MFDTDGLCHDWARLGHSVQHYSRPAKKAVIQPVLRSAASASLYCWIAAAACRPTLLAAAGLISYTGCLDTTFFHVGVPWLVIQGDQQAWKNYRGWLDTTSSFWKVPWLVIQGDQFRECLDTTFLCQKVFWSTGLIGCLNTTFLIEMPSKKMAYKETLVHSHLSPSLNGTRGIGTQKIVHWPPPPLWQ